jgi:glutamate---cysteine ligase / carboxylate-amine ligase
MKPPSLTLGIEEEYQIIDPTNGELKSYITQILEDGKLLLKEQIKAELHQSMVEVGTEICRTPAEARAELVKLRRAIMDLAARHGLVIAAAGTHPFSRWETQEITPFERYLGVAQDMGDLAQQLLIFGTHVHIGIEDKEFMIDCMNVARYFVPHILCLSTSSPFWQGRKTGLKSYRSIVFRNFPRSGIPPRFGSWDEFDGMVDTMVKTNCIPDGSKIWYDARPNHRYPTLEFRVCDVCTRVDECICIAALFQAIILKLWKLRQDNITFRTYPTELIEENKWRAVRYGLDGKLLDLGKQREVPVRDLIHELIDWFLRDVIDELGTRKEIEYAYKIMDGGTSADRQLATYQKSGGNIRAVVDQLVAETREGVI